MLCVLCAVCVLLCVRCDACVHSMFAELSLFWLEAFEETMRVAMPAANAFQMRASRTEKTLCMVVRISVDDDDDDGACAQWLYGRHKRYSTHKQALQIRHSPTTITTTSFLTASELCTAA